jgi:hypothetical protein
VPPIFVTILMSRRSTFVAVAGSITFSTASTAIGASRCEFCEKSNSATHF